MELAIVKKLEVEDAIEPKAQSKNAEATPRRPRKSSGIGERNIDRTAKMAVALKRITSKNQYGSEPFLRIAYVIKDVIASPRKRR